MLSKSRWLWGGTIVLDLLYSAGRMLASYSWPGQPRGAELSLKAMVRAGKVYESFRMMLGRVD